MTRDVEKNDLQDIKESLNLYFPDTKNSDEAEILDKIDIGEILYTQAKILPYLQTVFFEEHLLEFQPDQSTRVFFTNLLDDLPDIKNVESDDGGESDNDESSVEYEAGAYLKECDSFVVAPLNPAIGNARLRGCKLVVVRFYMGTTAVELGCMFRGVDVIGDMPVFRLNFPVIGRVNRDYRPFRVKVVSGVGAQITILRPMLDNAREKSHQLDDISTMGLAFHVLTQERNFEIGDQLCVSVQVPGVDDLEVEGTIRHISKARSKKGAMNICGVQFDLATRSLATDIERLGAAIQRLQLREIAERTACMKGVHLIK